MIAVTGANGKLGRLVIDGLRAVVSPGEIVAGVRNLANGAELRALGVDVREADYDRPDTLLTAFRGVDKVLLVSASMPGERLRQHKAAIDAAVAAKVRLLAYTSVLRADTSKLWLAGEHKATEAALRASGLPHVLLRYGWYIENNTDQLPTILARGEIVGTSGHGVFSGISRADCAAAAVAVLTRGDHDGKAYDLVGAHAYSIAELAEEISRQAGRTIAYRDLPPAEYTALLESFGLPELLVKTVVDAETLSKSGEFRSDSTALRDLTGTTPARMADVVRSALASTSATAAA